MTLFFYSNKVPVDTHLSTRDNDVTRFPTTKFEEEDHGEAILRCFSFKKIDV